MRLISIEATALPGIRDGRIDMARPTLFVGPNESGKSTLLGLALLAVHGPADRFGDTGSVVAQWDTGLTVRRGIQGGSHALEVGGAGTAWTSGPRKAQPLVDQAVGPAGRFRALAFEALTASKRQQALDRLLTMPWDDARRRLAMDRIQALLERDLPPEKRRLALQGQALIVATEDALAEAKRLNDARIAKLRAAADAASAQDLGTPPPGTAAKWRADVARIDGEIAALDQDAARGEGADAGRKVLEEELAALRRRLALREAVEHTVARYRHSANQHAAGRAAAEVALKVATERAKEAREAFEGAKTQADAAAKAVETAAAEAAEARALGQVARRLDPLFSAMDVLEHAATEETASLALGEAIAGVARVVASLREGVIGAPARAAESLAEAKATAGGLITRRDALWRTYRTADADESRFKGELERAGRALDQARAALAKDEEVLAGLAKAEARVQALEDQLAELPVAGGETAATLRAALLEQRATAQRNADRLADLSASEAEAAARRVELHDRLNDLRPRLLNAQKHVKKVAGGLLQEGLAPLVGVASEITEPVLGRTLRIDFTDAGAEVWLGPGDGQPDVRLADASTSTRAVGLMALQVAIQSRLPGWKHVLLDDLEGLDPTRRTAFVRLMAEWATAGRIDTFAAAMVADGWTPPDTVNVVTLEAPCPTP